MADITGTDIGEYLPGTPEDDVINARGGNDLIWAGTGNDVLRGGDGDDVFVIGGRPGDYSIIDGGAGIDFVLSILFRQGAAVNFTFTGNQVVTTDLGTFELIDIEHAQIVGSFFADVIVGGDSIDSISGELGDDVLMGRGGNDGIMGGRGNDLIDGGSGDDRLEGQRGADTLYGGLGNDTLIGGTGGSADAVGDNDRMYGQGGDDILDGSYFGDDLLDGGPGIDRADIDLYNSQSPIIFDLSLDSSVGNAVTGIKTLVSIEQISLGGGSGNDHLTGGGLDDRLGGGRGNDVIFGGAGNDVIVGGRENDYLDGGAGIDTLDYYGSIYEVFVDLSHNGYIDTIGAGIDFVTGFENAIGSEYDDILYGSDGANTIYGSTGADDIDGGAGDDVIVGDNDYVGDDAESDEFWASVDANFWDWNGDFLVGGDGKDIVLGGTGEDRIIGGAGADSLYGGDHADIFDYRALTDSKRDGADRIYDFDAAEGDKIDVSFIDAYNGRANGAFVFADGPAAHGIWVTETGTETVVHFDTNGQVQNDEMTIVLMGTGLNLTADSFIV